MTSVTVSPGRSLHHSSLVTAALPNMHLAPYVRAPPTLHLPSDLPHSLGLWGRGSAHNNLQIDRMEAWQHSHDYWAEHSQVKSWSWWVKKGLIS